MAMTPEERKLLKELDEKVTRLLRVLDVDFIESAKRRVVAPYVKDLGLDAVVSKTGAGSTSGTLRSVSESGSGSYSVANAYAGTITVRDAAGTSYKLGYYTP
jgi:hypothetical protein